ncbi:MULTISPECIES: hypothetical protein [Niastella]|uniref:Uncharacterized protein n=1 Tax=Niastella soli TaxID=2821487 RepID=A0ABS3Z0Z2_9BACT|nr:hypothetical protein [Niastella soli]MBO9203842.1 hypothetical protein [Niastella soli]
MKKKVFSAMGVAAIAAVVFFASKSNANSKNVDLSSLVKINTASAECFSSHGAGGGKCLSLAQFCVGDPGNNECDFGW